MIKFITLSGFLGAGKTTTMVHAAERLREAGHRVVVITNDQGTDLVDTATAQRSLGPVVGQVMEGCFCCRFEELADTTERLVGQWDADVVLAEAVGSCTDITATVVRPLRRLYGDRFQLAPLTAVVDPVRYRGFERAAARGAETDLMYLYRKQIQDADIVAINKADLLAGDVLTELVAAIGSRFPRAHVVPYSATRGTGLDDLVGAWCCERPDDGMDMTIDYQRYGVAEASLAWLNQVFELSAVGTFDSVAWARQVLGCVRDLCQDRGHIVGHVKLMVMGAEGATKASLTDSQGRISFDELGPSRVKTARITLNARVECEPAELEALVEVALREADSVLGVQRGESRGRSFKPGQPMPTHRLLASRG